MGRRPFGSGISLAPSQTAVHRLIRRTSSHRRKSLQYQENFSTGPAAQFVPALPIHMDDVALDELFASCMPKLARTARQMMRNAQDSEDVLQEGLLSAFQKLHQFQGRSKFSTWLHSIIKNAARMHMRRTSSYQIHSLEQVTSEQGSLSLESSSDRKPDTEERYAENERSRILRNALTQLPPSYQSVIQLCDIQGMGGGDAAARLGMTRSSLKTCLHRARRLVCKKIRLSYLPEDHCFQGAGPADVPRTKPPEFGPRRRQCKEYENRHMCRASRSQ